MSICARLRLIVPPVERLWAGVICPSVTWQSNSIASLIHVKRARGDEDRRDCQGISDAGPGDVEMIESYAVSVASAVTDVRFRR